MSGSDGNSVFPNYASYAYGKTGYTLHSKIMVAAFALLFVVVVFVLPLHIYAKWFWRQRYASSIRRQRLNFAGQEDSGVARSVGLEKAVIDTLPIFTYETRSEEEALECAVCLCEFRENEKGRLLPKCNHSFHIECIDMWFHSHSTCPLCRTRAVPDSTPDIPGAQEDASTESAAAILSQHMSSSLWVAGALQQVDSASENTGRRQTTRGAEHASSTSSISERFQQDQGMGYPVNALSWGDHSHASSHMSSSAMEQGHPGGRSLPHIAIDIPIRSESLLTPRRGGSFSSLLCPSAEELPCSPHNQPLKSPATRFKSLKRLCSRERKAPAAQHATGDCDQVGAFQTLEIGRLVQVT